MACPNARDQWTLLEACAVLGIREYEVLRLKIDIRPGEQHSGKELQRTGSVSSYPGYAVLIAANMVFWVATPCSPRGLQHSSAIGRERACAPTARIPAKRR